MKKKVVEENEFFKIVLEKINALGRLDVRVRVYDKVNNKLVKSFMISAETDRFVAGIWF